MDRRQQKTRDAIFGAFKELLAERDYAGISVADICERAGVGRTTFYAHFDTKDALLDEVCEAIFQHVFNTPEHAEATHDYSSSAADLDHTISHLLHHIADNDLGVADLLRGQSGELVSAHFRRGLFDLASAQVEDGLLGEAYEGIPRSFLAHHFAESLIGTIHWWIMRGMRETPETVAAYFVRVLGASQQSTISDQNANSGFC